MKQQHKLDLLDNALDSLAEALGKYQQGQEGDPKAYKFAVLHMSHFIELMFKHHISTIHPVLIYKNPFAKNLDTNKTIGLWDAINFINNENPDSISPEVRKDLEWIKVLRNDIEHHKFEMNLEEVRATLGRIFRSVVAFLDEHTDITLEGHIPRETKDTFNELADEYAFRISEALRQATEIEEALIDLRGSVQQVPVRLRCSACGHETLVADESSSSGYKCYFCGAEDGDEIPAYCDCCGAESTVGELSYAEWHDGKMEARCYYCSGQYQMDKDD